MIRSFCCIRKSCLAGAGLLLGLGANLSAAEMRTWTSVDGKQLSAALVHADSTDVIFKMKGGREARVPLSRLVEEDREFIAAKLRVGKAFEIQPMPDETQAPRELDVEGGPRIFQTPHFQFETDQDVLRGFIAEAARVYEGTYHALNGLPLGLKFGPPEGETHFRGRFMNDSEFNAIASQKMGTMPGQRVVGLYLGKEKELLVPYSSLGAVRKGTRLSLRKSSDTSTLIHEIVHQVMHEWLPVIPTWFSEGMAEYISAVPYQNGRFEFVNAERGLKETLEEQHRITGSVEGVKRPSEYFEAYLVSDAKWKAKDEEKTVPGPDLSSVSPAGRPADPDGWTGRVSEYRDAMLTVYFFMHLYDQRNPGAPVGAYLRMVDSSLGDTEKVREVMNQFEEKRLAYNADVERFNAELRAFQKEVDAYNDRVRMHNEQIEQGLPKEERVVVGEIPAEPVPPKDLVIPEEMEAARVGGVINLAAMVKRTSLPGMLQGRDLSRLDEEMQEAYAKIGIEIRYE
jgi:hypothetical protein